MAGPWEQYRQPAAPAPAAAGPWSQYQAAAPEIVDLPAVQAAPPDPTDDMSGRDRFLAGMGKAFVDTGRGLKQAGTDAARYFVEEGLGMEAPGLRASLAKQQQEIDQARERDAPLMDTAAGLTGNVAGYTASMLLPAGAARGTALARGLLPSTVGGNALLGAGMGALQPVATGDSRAGQTALGAGAGAGGAVIAKGVGALASRAGTAISDQARVVYEAAKARGIELTPAQLSDSAFVRRVQHMLRSVPFTGAQERYASQVDDLNRQVARTIGEDAPRVNAEVYSLAKARQSKMFNDLTARNDLKVDMRLMQGLSNIADSAKISPAIAQDVNAAIDSLFARAVTGPDGVKIPGAAYQAFDSEMGQIIKSGGTAAHFLGNVQSAVRRAMDDSISPADRAAWAQVRKEYGNRKTLAPLVAKSGDEALTPASLMGAVTNSRTAKEAMASGTRGELGELAKIGQRMKAPPSSGTAENLLSGGALNPINWPAYGAGLAVGAPVSRVLDSQALTRYLMRKNPGMTRKAAAKIAQRMASPAGLTYNSQEAPPLEIDITGGTPVSAEEAQRLFGGP
jgi:hypothetical protein